MKLAALVSGALLLAAPAYAQTSSHFDLAVEACTLAVRQAVEPDFLAYVINDGIDNNINMFGTASARFRFDYCMNYLGHPLADIDTTGGHYP